jgi:hypothetical protein
MQLAFGAGALWAERTDVQIGTTGGNGAQQFGTLQDVAIDFDWTTKELYGQNQFPVAIGRGQAKITGKAKLAQIESILYSDIFFGTAASAAAGQRTVALREAATIPGTPYQVTVANSSNYVDDLGVFFASSGLPMKRVASAPATGQYTVNYATGVYTFAAADTTKAVVINYVYNITSTGTLITISNTLMGYIPSFKATFYQTYTVPGGSAESLMLRLNACTSNKLAIPTKLDDWMIHEMDFMAFADSSGTVGYLSTVE